MKQFLKHFPDVFLSILAGNVYKFLFIFIIIDIYIPCWDLFYRTVRVMSDVKNIAFFTLLLYLCVSTSNQKHNKGIESSIDSNNFYIPFQFSLKKTVSEHLKHKIIIKSHLVNWHIFSTWTALYTVVAVDLPQASLFWGQILARFLLLACWLYRSALN